MKKRIVSLALALALCLSLTVPALADDAVIELSTDQGFINLNSGQAANGSGWSWDGSKLTLSGFSGHSIHCTAMNGLVISLAPGTVNKIHQFTVSKGTSNEVVMEGSGELIIEGGENLAGMEEAFECAAGVKLTFKDGLTMTGGQSQGASEPIIIDEDGYASTSSRSYVDYIRIAPIGGSDTHTSQAPVPTFKFQDVSVSSPYYSAIKWAVDNKITNGRTLTYFGTNDTCTVSNALTFLFRTGFNASAGAVGQGYTGEGESIDVWNWAKSNKMVSSNLDEYNIPDSISQAPCTRAMAVTYMWKDAGSPVSANKVSFTDVPAGASYAKAVAWAVEQGITTGTSSAYFSPDKPCTRGQIVTFLYRAYNR